MLCRGSATLAGGGRVSTHRPGGAKHRSPAPLILMAGGELGAAVALQWRKPDTSALCRQRAGAAAVGPLIPAGEDVGAGLVALQYGGALGSGTGGGGSRMGEVVVAVRAPFAGESHLAVDGGGRWAP